MNGPANKEMTKYKTGGQHAGDDQVRISRLSFCRVSVNACRTFDQVWRRLARLVRGRPSSRRA